MKLSFIPTLLHAFVLGGVGYGLFWYWRKCLGAWDAWQPSMKKLARAGLTAAAVVLAILLLRLTSDDLDMTAIGAAAMFGFCAIPARRLARGHSLGGPEHPAKPGLATAATIAAMVKKSKRPADVTFGGAPVPVDLEARHLLVAGAPGSLKNDTFVWLLDTLKERGDTVIVFDPQALLLQRYWNPATDLLFNPYDARSCSWNPLGEIEALWDVEALARAMSANPPAEFREQAPHVHALLTVLLQKVVGTEKKSLAELLRLVQTCPVAELQGIIQGSPAAYLLDASVAFDTVRAAATQQLACYRALVATEGNASLSLTQFVQSKKDSFLFITVSKEQLPAVRNILTAMLDTVVRALLALPENPQRRVWLVLPDLATFGKIPSLVSLPVPSKDASGRLALGVQSLPELADSYGDTAAVALLQAMSSAVALNCDDEALARYLSERFGKVAKNASGKGGPEEAKPLVDAADLEALGARQALLKLAGSFPLCAVEIDSPEKYGAATEAFVPAQGR